MLTSGRPHSGPFGSRLRATLVASLVCALALLALPALASASWNLTVAKTTIPSGGTGFDFTVTGPSSYNQAVNNVDDGSSASGGSGLTEGTDNWVITETNPAPYALTAIDCTSPTGGAIDLETVNLVARSVTIQVNGTGNPNVTCTFTNSNIPTTGTIKVRKGGDRNTGSNAELDYASPLESAVFEYSTTSNFAAIDGTITTDAAGVGTKVVNNGTYYVREATAPTGFTDVSPLQSLFFDPTSGVPATSQPYVSKVVVSGGQTTEAFPNQTPNASAANWDSATAGNTGSPFVNVRNNAVFPDYCGLKIQLVLDRSGSIDQYKTSYRDAAQAFVDALDGTPSQIGITSFSRGVNENAVGGNGGQTGNLNAQAPLSIDTGSPLNAQILKNKIADVYSDPGGGTDWDAALRDASTRVGFTPTAPSATDKPDIVVFITDGNPTAHGGPNSDPGSNVDLMDLTYGIASANLLKNVTAHDTTKVKMLAVGVGTGVTPGNLKAVSGPNDDSNPDPDYAASSVDALVLKLQELASQTCGSRIVVRKTLLGAGVDNTPQAGWNYTATSPSTVSYSDPDNTAPYSTHGSPAQLTVALNNVPVTGTTAQITEDAAGQPLPAGEYAYTSTVCRLKGSAGWDANNPFTTGTIVGSAVARGVSLTGIARGSDYYCTATNTKQKPVVTLTKTAAASPINAGDNASFTITASNAGPGTATGVVVTDNLPAAYNWTENSTDCTIAGAVGSQVMTCNFGTIASGANKAVTITAPTSFAACATIPNTASATATNTDPIANANASIVCNKPNVTTTKTAAASPINAGDNASFTITTSNAGPGTATGVVVTDNLPAAYNWTENSTDCTIAGAVGSQVMTCNFGTIASGANKAVTITAPTSFAACATIPNTASTTGTNTGTIANANASIVCNKPNVTTTKTAAASPINAGDNASFTITTSNAGPGTATGVVVTDNLPAAYNWTENSTDCTIAGAVGSQVMTCNFGTIASGANKAVTLTAPTSFAACATIPNTASTTGTNTGTIANANASIVCNKPNVTTTKTAAASPINAGDNASFTITTSNAGPGTATGVVVTDNLPAAYNWTENSADCTIAGAVGSQVMTCNFGTIASGANKAVTLTAPTTATACATINNTASTTGTNTGTIANANASIVCNKPNLTVDKTPDNQTISAGTDAEFTITVGNSGPGVAKSATLSDPLPASGNWSISQAVNAGTCAITGPVGTQVLNCTFGDLASGATRTLKVKSATTAGACATYDNTATASSTNNDPSSVQNSGKITCQAPGLAVDKTPDNQTIDAGDDAEFTITLSNNGPGVATGATLSDPLPANGNWSISQAVNAGTCAITGPVGTQVLNCTFGDLAASATRTLKVKSATTAGACATYDNTATGRATNTADVTNSGKITCRKPDVKVSKTPDNQTIDAGDDAEFTITAQNDGPGLAKSVTLSDPLPASGNWSISQAVNAGTCAITGAVGTQTLNCTFGDLASGATRTLKVKSATTATSCATYDNTATASSTNNNPGSVQDSGKITCRKPDLKVSKTPDNQTIDAGDDAEFTITAQNDGPGLAKSVTLSDPLPANGNWSISQAVNAGTCAITGAVGTQTLNCTFGDLASGATRTLKVKSATTATSCATYDNTATASSTNNNPGSVNDSGKITCRKPDLKVSKTPDNQTIDAGDDAEFTITAQNDGPGLAKSVTLSDPLPANGNWSISQAVNAGTCAITGAVGTQTLNCTFGDLAANATRTLKVKSATTATSCGIYDNTATASSTNNDPSSVQNSGKITCQAPGLAVDKTPDNQTIDAGDDAEFTITLSNNGSGVATGATLSDPLPANGNWSISQAVNAGTCAITGAVGSQTLNCTFGDLASGATRTLKVKSATTASACATYDNTATASSTNNNPGSVNDSGKITCRKPDLKVSKTPDNQTIDAGDDAEFTITAQNDGPGLAKSVTLSDPLPANGNWSISQAVNAGTCAITGAVGTQTLNCTFGDLASGATRTLKVKSATTATSCATYDNTATASSTNNNPGSVQDSGKITCRKPDVKVSKTPDNQTIDAGDDAEFTITAQNDGPGLAKSVTLSDPLPANGNWSISQAVNAGTCAITGAVGTQTLNCTFGDLASSATRTLKVKSATTATSCATYDNTATASSTNNNPGSVNDSGKITCRKPDLKVSKTPDNQTIDAGDDAEFTITAQNDGPGLAKSVTLSDPLPANGNWSISQAVNAGTCAITGAVGTQTLNCTFGDLASGATRTLKVKSATTATSCGIYDNTATASSTNNNPGSVNDSGKITCRKPGLKVTKTADADSVSAGSAIGFTVKTENTGPGTATGVTLNDPLPNGVDWTIDPANSDCEITGAGDDQVLTCNFGTLADGASETVHVTATTSYANCTTYDNEATASATNAPDAKDDATTQCLKPDLKVEKTADKVTVDAGDPIGFTVKTTNNGAGTATGVTLNDPLPNGVDWTISPANTDCEITGTGDDQVLSCDFGSLEEGASAEVHVTATTSYQACTTYDNEATASATNAPNAKDDATIQCRKPDLTVEKTADDASVSAGSAIGFTVKTTNNGPGTANGVTLNDPLPNGVDWTIDPANSDCEITGTGDDQVLTCDFGTLADDASETVHVTATTSYANCTTYDNEATASATNAPNAKDDATTQCLKPDLKVEKTADAATVDAGDAIGFTVKTTNNGPGTATGVTLNDPLPNGVDWTISPANADCEITGTGDDQVLTCNFGTLADDASETVHVTATTSYANCTTYDNEATASATNAPNAKDDATTQCLKPDLKVEKTADAATVDAGDAIGFTVKTTNNGPGTATSVTLNDPLPNGVDWTVSPANADCEITGTGDDQVLTCNFGTLADDASETVHVTATTSYANCTTYDNEATASATNAPNAKDDASVTCRKSGLKVTKTADADSVSAGSAIGFTVKTENTGPGTATGVTLNDPLPNGVDWTIDPANSDCEITGTGDDQVLTCNFGTLADGASETVHVTATTSYANCTTYDNEATASATNAPNATDDATTQCLKPDLKVEKTADKVTVDAGDPIGFTVKTTNNGAGTATGVTLNDPLPNVVDWTISPANTDCEITGTGDDQVLSCDFGSLEEGASAEVHVTATTTETACTTYDNEATASATNAPSAKDDATIECQKPDLGVDKAALQVTVDAGDDVSFDITTSNAGPGTAKGVTLNDPLPNGVDWSIAPANADCEITGTGDDQVLTCDFGDIPAGESRKVTVTASTSFEQCTEYANTATADAINAPAKTDSDTITCQKPDVSLLKKATKATVDAGDPIEFTITATNSGLPGTGNAKGVVIKDDLPGNAGADWSVVSPQADCAISGAVGSEQLTCAPIDLAPGANYDVVVTSATSYDNCGVYDNTATFSPAQPRQAIDADPIVVTGNAGSGQSNTATITCQKPALDVEKTADDAVVDAGEAVGFTMTTTNGGPGTAKSVTLKDALPAGLTWSINPASANCEITGDPGDQLLSCDYGDLGDDASRTVHVTATTSFEQCSEYSNEATVSAKNAPDASDDDSTRCRQPATVRIDKVVEGEPGSETKFAFTSDLDPNAQDQDTAFQLADADPLKVYTVRPGTYQVTESDPRGLGYVLANASCAPTEQQMDDVAERKNVNNPEDGKVSVDLAEGADVTCTFVNTKLTSAIEVVKSPKTQSVYLDGTATYTYKVTNTGSSDLSNVTATDDRCAPLTRTDAGNNDPENLLEQGETWTYTCSVSAATLFGSSTTPVTNTVTATGIDRKETKVQDTDTAVTNVLIPGIAIDKTGPATATAGELITYDLAVTNTGNTSFEQANVKLTDTVVTPSGGVCSGDLATPKDKKGDQTPGQLNPGETWVYQCQVQTKVGDTKVTNKGAVNGTDSGGKVVTANDTAETTLAAPAGNVSPAGKVSGRARLTGSVGCVASSYAKATVSGNSIKQVTFYVNGKKAKTLKKPNSGRNYQLRLRTKSLKYGTYKVRAKVQFVTGASPQTRNLDLQFNRCRPRVIKPKFTG